MPDGKINLEHPLWPKSRGAQTEWGNHAPLPGPSDCGPQSLNSRTGLGPRLQTPATGTPPPVETGDAYWPFKHTYDAAGNLRNDDGHWFVYDGLNKLKDVDLVAIGAGGEPEQGTHFAHFVFADDARPAAALRGGRGLRCVPLKTPLRSRPRRCRLR